MCQQEGLWIRGGKSTHGQDWVICPDCGATGFVRREHEEAPLPHIIPYPPMGWSDTAGWIEELVAWIDDGHHAKTTWITWGIRPEDLWDPVLDVGPYTPLGETLMGPFQTAWDWMKRDGTLLGETFEKVITLPSVGPFHHMCESWEDWPENLSRMEVEAFLKNNLGSVWDGVGNRWATFLDNLDWGNHPLELERAGDWIPRICKLNGSDLLDTTGKDYPSRVGRKAAWERGLPVIQHWRVSWMRTRAIQLILWAIRDGITWGGAWKDLVAYEVWAALKKFLGATETSAPGIEIDIDSMHIWKATQRTRNSVVEWGGAEEQHHFWPFGIQKGGLMQHTVELTPGSTRITLRLDLGSVLVPYVNDLAVLNEVWGKWIIQAWPDLQFGSTVELLLRWIWNRIFRTLKEHQTVPREDAHLTATWVFRATGQMWPINRELFPFGAQGGSVTRCVCHLTTPTLVLTHWESPVHLCVCGTCGATKWLPPKRIKGEEWLIDSSAGNSVRETSLFNTWAKWWSTSWTWAVKIRHEPTKHHHPWADGENFLIFGEGRHLGMFSQGKDLHWEDWEQFWKNSLAQANIRTSNIEQQKRRRMELWQPLKGYA